MSVVISDQERGLIGFGDLEEDVMPNLEHLAEDCDDPGCRRLHRVISRVVEKQLLGLPNEYALFDREGVRYHGPDLLPLCVQAQAELGLSGASKLTIYFVPDPNVGHFYEVGA